MATAPHYTEIDRMGNSCNGRGGARPRYFFLHTQEGDGTAESLAGYLNDPSHDASYHYTLRDGVLVDVVNTDMASWSVGDANGYSINLCFAGSRAGWSRAQWLARDNDLRIAAWIAVQDARKYGFSPAWLGSGGHYTQSNQGVSDHQYVTDVIGWGSHTDCGPGFPGDIFARYLAEYAGTAAPEGDNEMQLSDQITDAYGNKVSVADVLKYASYHADLILDQLGGIDTRKGIPAKFPGWPQLGGKTVVDSLAEAHAKLDKLTKAIEALAAGGKA
jgi:hypothetical protein